MKKIAVVLTALMLSSFLVACSDAARSENVEVDTGVVIYSHRKTIKVLEDDGETDTYRVARSTVRKCSVGERWPDCKK